jgi:hypothetical protein
LREKKIILGLECPQEIMAQAHCGTVQIKYTIKSLTIYFTYIKKWLGLKENIIVIQSTRQRVNYYFTHS